MPRTKPIPTAERQVCERFHQVKRWTGKPRQGIARALGISPAFVSNLEYGLAPVRFVVGYNLCREFNVSLRWLATGKLPQTPFTPCSEQLLSKIGPRSIFSDAYARHLDKVVTERLELLAKDAGVKLEDLGKGCVIYDRYLLGLSITDSYFENVLTTIKEVGDRMSDGERLQFASRLHQLAMNAQGVGQPVPAPVTDSKPRGHALPAKSPPTAGGGTAASKTDPSP